MGHHIDSDGRFQSDRHPDLAPDKIVLSFQDERAHQALERLAWDSLETDEHFAKDVARRLMTIRADRDLSNDSIRPLLTTDATRINRYLGPDG